MKKAILGKKLGMTQIFSANGLVVPVTVVEAGPCFVTQVKSMEKDGYKAVQVAFDEKRENIVITVDGVECDWGPLVKQPQKGRAPVFRGLSLFVAIGIYEKQE